MIVVVVPAYNEETQIARVFDLMPAFVDRIVVVDDASRDGTKDVVTTYAAHDSRIVLLRHERNSGVGAAIATGYKWARDSKADVAVVMAGDGQMDPEDLPALLDPVVDGAVDYSKGNRLLRGEAYRVMPKARYFGNAVLSLLTKIASGYWHVADSQSGYTAINRKALLAIDWDAMYKRYGQPNDLLVRLNVESLRVRDVMVRPVYNIGERSGIRLPKVVFTISWLLACRFLWRLREKYVIRDFHPLVLFYALGVLLLLIGTVFFAHTIVLWIRQGHVPEISALVWMFSSTMGLQSLFFAMWFDMEANKDLR